LPGDSAAPAVAIDERALFFGDVVIGKTISGVRLLSCSGAPYRDTSTSRPSRPLLWVSSPRRRRRTSRRRAQRRNPSRTPRARRPCRWVRVGRSARFGTPASGAASPIHQLEGAREVEAREQRRARNSASVRPWATPAHGLAFAAFNAVRARSAPRPNRRAIGTVVLHERRFDAVAAVHPAVVRAAMIADEVSGSREIGRVAARARRRCRACRG